LDHIKAVIDKIEKQFDGVGLFFGCRRGPEQGRGRN